MNQEEVLNHAQTILSFLQAETPSQELPGQMDGIFVPANIHPRVAIHASILWKAMPEIKAMVVAGARDTDRYLKVLKEREVPKEIIVWEMTSTTTRQKVMRGMDRCKKRGLRLRKVAICAPLFLTFRIKMTFKIILPDVSVYGCSFRYKPHLLTNKENMYRAWSEFGNLERYARKGEISPFVIPEDVRFAKSEIERIFGFN